MPISLFHCLFFFFLLSLSLFYATIVCYAVTLRLRHYFRAYAIFAAIDDTFADFRRPLATISSHTRFAPAMIALIFRFRHAAAD